MVVKDRSTALLLTGPLFRTFSSLLSSLSLPVLMRDGRVVVMSKYV